MPEIIKIIIITIKDDDGDGGEGGDSLLDYNDTEEKDSLLDNESVSGSNLWGSKHGDTGFGSSLFNAVISSSWMSFAPNGPPNHGPAHGSSYGTGRNSLRPRSWSCSHHSQMDHSSHRGDNREDVHIGMDHDIRKFNLHDYSNDRNTYGENIVGLSVLSTELQLQSIKRQLLDFLPPPVVSNEGGPGVNSTVGVSTKRGGTFFTPFNSSSPVRRALNSFLTGLQFLFYFTHAYLSEILI